EGVNGQPESRAVAISQVETGDRVPPTAAGTRPFMADPEQGGDDGWSILWPFIGINVALLALALIVRQAGGGAGAKTRISAPPRPGTSTRTKAPTASTPSCWTG
ncbi:MAG TPA: hypothetical protein PLY96_06975, partial [Chromatiaceae bacterium]|nr:hypothetical protein [Chromatiaceae bacterium]